MQHGKAAAQQVRACETLCAMWQRVHTGMQAGVSSHCGKAYSTLAGGLLQMHTCHQCSRCSLM